MTELAFKKSRLDTMHSVLTAVLLSTLLLSGCGYHNPYMQPDGSALPPKSVFLDIWPNQTTELGLETEIFRALVHWFKGAPSIQVTHNPAEADYLVNGEIQSIDLPALAFGQYDQAIEIRVILKISFLIREKMTGKILHEQKGLTFEEAARVGADATTSRDNKRQALDLITADIAERVYLDTLEALYPR
jgi:hypothetical protein